MMTTTTEITTTNRENKRHVAPAENDFMANGGDGYPNVFARGTTQNILGQVWADYIAENTPLSPVLARRIVCTTSGATACPVPVP